MNEPFDYSITEPEDAGKVRDLEAVHRLQLFIKERIIGRLHGRLPSAKTIGVRLVVFQMLIDTDGRQSFAQAARELGCSRAWLSKVGLIFAEQLGARASFQRLSARDTYSERAREVHAGNHVSTDKWLRRRWGEKKASAASLKATEAEKNGGHSS